MLLEMVPPKLQTLPAVGGSGQGVDPRAEIEDRASLLERETCDRFKVMLRLKLTLFSFSQ